MRQERFCVLCIDDDPQILEALEFVLVSELGVELKLASTLKSAEEKIVNAEIGFITLDIMISGYVLSPGREISHGGLALLHNIRNGVYGADRSDIPVAVVSGRISEADKRFIGKFTNGKTWSILKPLSTDELVEVVQEIIGADNA